MPIKKFNVYSERCPSRNVLEGISNKWSILIINNLSKKTCRFGELKRQIEGISAKMLTQTLRILERYGFVDRQHYPEVVFRVEYSLTKLGKELGSLLSSLTAWTEKNMDAILHNETMIDDQRDDSLAN